MFGLGKGTKEANKVIEGHALHNWKSVKEFIGDLKKEKPAGYDAHIEKMRDFYEGNQTPYVEAELRRAFQSSAEKMPASVLNLTRLDAELDAQAYKQEPIRRVLTDSETEQEDFKTLLKKWRLSAIMPELERRLMVANTMFCRLSWDNWITQNLGVESFPEIALFYPDKVHVKVNPRAPTDIRAALAVVVDISTETTEGYEIWTQKNGEILVSTMWDGGEQSPPEKWECNFLPWVVFHPEISQASLFLDVKRDRAGEQIDINREYSDRNWRVQYQSHKQVIVLGGDPDDATFAVGPSLIANLSAGADVKVLDLTTNDTSLDDLQKILKMHGTLNRHSPDSWNSDSTAPLSGVSRLIANQGANEKRWERSEHYKMIEERYLLPLMCEVSAVYGSNIGKVNTREFEVQFQAPVAIEAPLAKVNKNAVEQDKGWKTKARAATDAGAYASIEEAVSKGVSDDFQEATGQGQGTGSLSLQGGS